MKKLQVTRILFGSLTMLAMTFSSILTASCSKKDQENDTRINLDKIITKTNITRPDIYTDAMIISSIIAANPRAEIDLQKHLHVSECSSLSCKVSTYLSDDKYKPYSCRITFHASDNVSALITNSNIGTISDISEANIKAVITSMNAGTIDSSFWNDVNVVEITSQGCKVVPQEESPYKGMSIIQYIYDDLTPPNPVGLIKTETTTQSNEPMKTFVGLSIGFTLPQNYHIVTIPADVECFGRNIGWNQQGLEGFEEYPQIDTIVFAPDSQCGIIGMGIGVNNQLANIKVINFSNIVVHYGLGANAFMAEFGGGVTQYIFGNTFDGNVGWNCFLYNETIEELTILGSSPLRFRYLWLASDNGNQKISKVYIERDIVNLPDYFIFRWRSLTDVYFYGDAPESRNVGKNWIGDATDNADNYLAHVKFHFRAEFFADWKAIFDDTSNIWNTSNVFNSANLIVDDN